MYHVKNGKYTYLSFTQCHKVILMADPKCSLYKAGNVFFDVFIFLICTGGRMILGMLI